MCLKIQTIEECVFLIIIIIVDLTSFVDMARFTDLVLEGHGWGQIENKACVAPSG